MKAQIFGVEEVNIYYGPRYAGTSVYRQGDGSKHNTRQKWNLKVENPQQFLKAFKAFLNDNKKVFGDRWISLSAYTVGNPGGATHSVTMSGESWMELELRYLLMAQQNF